ncbi:hypothetical protein [Halocatena salina]|uniref:Nickel/cobalt efflux system n=1 Tax=Halocatena salina TaxID=2934340 RepID=A0A8U0A3W0_9EURY|nr:hypothetical protein [Halocatena salina]UPM42653.1 hypothetical protein MW046_11905 [Halocatena salina]
MLGGSLSIVVSTMVLGFIHGAEPGHGWPIAAVYALDRSNRWLSGLVAGLLIGVGHLVSSIAVVGLFFLLKTYSGVSQFGWLQYVAGVLLILLGVHEYRAGHTHDHSHDHAGDTDHDHQHDTGGLSGEDPRGLWGITSAAFVLGFAHEEEFQIIALCTGSTYCLELMMVYAVAVIVALLTLTLLLIGGFERYEERIERYAEYLPTMSAAVLILMGCGFVAGVL